MASFFRLFACCFFVREEKVGVSGDNSAPASAEEPEEEDEPDEEPAHMNTCEIRDGQS